MKPILFLLILFPLCLFTQETKKETFTNPVWDGADSWLVKQDSDYI